MSSSTDSLKTIRDLVRYLASEFNRNRLFFGHGTDNALDEATALVIHQLAMDFDLPDTYLDCHVTEDEKQIILELGRLRISSRKPLAQLTGNAYFAGLTFHVDEHVLVPRSPLAELITDQFHPWVDAENIHRILDLCTGSGCIGIASAMYLPESEVIISDISDDALRVAQQNIDQYELTERVHAVKSDVFNDIPQKPFDLIVSNPPYVSTDEYNALPAEYHNEPAIGLEAGVDGMDIVSRILTQATSYLTDNGVIIIEVGASAELLMEKYPQVAFNWIDFEHGGDGVFIFTREELLSYLPVFSARTDSVTY